MSNEERVDGRELAALDETGSDERLSDEVRERIAQAEGGDTASMSDQTVDPPEPAEDEEARRRREEAERRGEREPDEGERTEDDGEPAEDAPA